MTNKDKVQSRYPHASAEQESTGEWSVWDISLDKMKRLNEKHWPKTFSRGLFGLGRTEAEAWADAVRNIEQREGRRLPVPNARDNPPANGRRVDRDVMRQAGDIKMTDYKSMFEQAVLTLAAIDEALGIGDDGCGDPEQTLTAIAELKALQKMESPQLRKIHPLDFPLEVFLSDLTTRPANIIRAELAGFASYAGTGTFDIEPPFTVRHLCMFSRSEMRKWPNFGRKCLNEVEEMLRARGLQLWENHDERSLRLLREHKEYFK